MDIGGLGWLLLSLGPLLLLQRRFHQEIQAVFLLITRRIDLSIFLFSVLFFPGVLLHETSHYVMAHILRVRTGRFSIFPQALPDGRLQLGFVETAAADPLRETLIGAAPLISGGLFVAYAGLYGLGLSSAWLMLDSQGLQAILDVLAQLVEQPDFWLWLYLTLVVSSTMLPSAADRRAWLPVAGVIVVLLVASLLAGAGPWMAQNLAPYFEIVLSSVAIVLWISVLVHAVLLVPVWLVRRLVSWITGLEVVL